MSTDIVFLSVCRTLVHSLWQGLVLAILAAIVLLFTRKTSAVLRYNLLSALMVVFVAVVVFTFYTAIHTQPAAIGQSSVPEQTGAFFSPVLVTYTNDGGLQQQQAVSWTMLDRVAGFLDRNASFIVGLWFLFFIIRCGRLFMGLRQVKRLRTRQVTPVNHHWHEWIDRYTTGLGIKTSVQLLESALVRTPSVIGFLKPVILLPTGLLAHLTAEEAEAVLLHELAHIRRKDYLINLIQGLCETLLFFNPGFMWLSSLLRTERENCCDDMAVSVTQNKTGFIRALVMTQQYGHSSHGLALGFGHQKKPLLNRAVRLLQNRNQPISHIEKTFLSVCIAVCLCMAYVFTGNGSAVAQNTVLPQSVSTLNHDSLDRAQRKTVLEIQLAEAEKVLDDFEKNMPAVTGSDRPEEINRELELADLQMKKADIEMALADIAMEEADIEMAQSEEERIKAEKEAAINEALHQDMLKELNKKLGTQIDSYALTREKLIVNGIKQTEALRQYMAGKYLGNNISTTYRYDLKTGHTYTVPELAAMQQKHDQEMLRMAELERQQAEKKRLEMEREKMVADSARQNSLPAAILEDLKERFGEVSSYELSTGSLIVNGQKQPDALLKQFSKKYLHGNMTVSYSLENGKKSTSISTQ